MLRQIIYALSMALCLSCTQKLGDETASIQEMKSEAPIVTVPSVDTRKLKREENDLPPLTHDDTGKFINDPNGVTTQVIYQGRSD